MLTKYIAKRIVLIFLNLFIIVSALYIISDYVMYSNWSFPRPSFFSKISWVMADYKDFLKRIFTKWDWGYTFNMHNRVSVWEFVVPRAKMSMIINLLAFVLYTGIGIILGIIAAYKKDTIVDRLICYIITFFNSIPSFVLILFMLIFFGYYLKWFPAVMMPKDSGKYYQSFIIPLLALILPQLSQVAILVRAEIVEQAKADYVMLAKVKGFSARRILFKHNLKNALIPVIPTLPHLFMSVMLTSVYIEKASNIDGLANLILDSVFIETPYGIAIYFDIPFVLVICFIYSAMAMLVGLVIDIVFRFIDPQIRVGRRKQEA